MSAEVRYVIVVNHEDQHSVWFAGRELPAGWRRVGEEGTKRECLDRIEEMWTDITPRSVREGLTAPSTRTPAS